MLMNEHRIALEYGILSIFAGFVRKIKKNIAEFAFLIVFVISLLTGQTKTNAEN